MNKAVVFNRVSSGEQGEGFSLEAQADLAVEYAARKNLHVVKTWCEEESASKENQRYRFFEMLEFVRQNNIKHVVFEKVDRALRGLKSAVMVEELIEHNGVRFHFAKEHLEVDKDSPPQEKLRLHLGTILAKYYIDNQKAEINKGLKKRFENGFWNSKAPFGYKNVRINDRATVIPDEVKGPLVKEIF